MNTTEKEVILNVIRRLQCAESPRHTAAHGTPSYGESVEVRLALTGSVDPAGILPEDDVERLREYALQYRVPSVTRCYLNSWVIGALEALLDEEDGGTGRDLNLAKELSK